MFENFVWDFDGTLINSYPCIFEIYEKILKRHGIDPNMVKIREIAIRESSKEVKEYIEKEYGISCDDFKKEYDEISRQDEYIKKLTILDNSNEICRIIKEKGYKNFIITNRDDSVIKSLKILNMYELFDEIIYNGYLDMTKRKPDPEAYIYLKNKYRLNPEKTLYIGDRDLDVITSQKVGFKTCLYNPIEGYKSKPDYIIHSFKDLEKFI